MSISDALLALLTIEPSNGYALKQELQARTAGTVGLNDGQVYTTIARLERDRLIERRAQGGGTSNVYAATHEGHRAAEEWFSTARVQNRRPDDLALKVAFCDRPRDEVVAMLERALSDLTGASCGQPSRVDSSGAPLAALILEGRRTHRQRAQVMWIETALAAFRADAQQS